MENSNLLIYKPKIVSFFPIVAFNHTSLIIFFFFYFFLVHNDVLGDPIVFSSLSVIKKCNLVLSNLKLYFITFSPPKADSKSVAFPELENLLKIIVNFHLCFIIVVTVYLIYTFENLLDVKNIMCLLSTFITIIMHFYSYSDWNGEEWGKRQDLKHKHV